MDTCAGAPEGSLNFPNSLRAYPGAFAILDADESGSSLLCVLLAG